MNETTEWKNHAKIIQQRKVAWIFYVRIQIWIDIKKTALNLPRCLIDCSSRSVFLIEPPNWEFSSIRHKSIHTPKTQWYSMIHHLLSSILPFILPHLLSPLSPSSPIIIPFILPSLSISRKFGKKIWRTKKKPLTITRWIALYISCSAKYHIEFCTWCGRDKKKLELLKRCKKKSNFPCRADVIYISYAWRIFPQISVLWS